MKQTTKFQELLEVAKSYETLAAEEVGSGFHVEGFESVEAYVEMRNEYEDYSIADFDNLSGGTPSEYISNIPIIVVSYDNNKYVSVLFVSENGYVSVDTIHMYMTHEVNLFEEGVMI